MTLMLDALVESRIPAGEVLKQVYPCLCPVCEEMSWAIPSELMQGGLNSGCTTCPSCDAVLHLEIDFATGRMTAQVWEEWFKTQICPPLAQLYPAGSEWFTTSGAAVAVQEVVADGRQLSGREARDQLHATPF